MSPSAFKNHSAEISLFSRRVWVAVAIVLLFVSVLLGRLVYLQIIQRQVYATMSDKNQFELIPIDPNRGLIYDRNGVLLADNIPTFSLDVVPERIKNFDQVLQDLQQIIDISPDDVKQYRRALRQQRSSASGVPLKFNLTEEEVARFYLNQYKFPGLQVTGRLMRYYPLGSSMVSVLGYVSRINEQELKQLDTNYAASNYIGKLGVEKYYEEDLHGTAGYQQVEMDANGHVIRVLKHQPPVAGSSLYLSIDSGLQQASEAALGDDEGSVVAIDPKTGQVLAFVSKPGYDPNMFVRGVKTDEYNALQTDPLKPLYNRPLRGLYPAGSTVKPILAVKLLDDNIVSPDYTIFDNGFFHLPNGSNVWRDWNWRTGGHGTVNLHAAIVESCDVYFYTTSMKMGINRLHDIETQFGFGQRTGLDVGEELGGVAPSPTWKLAALKQKWFPGDTVNTSIGQGYTLVTPLQIANAVAAIANRGVRYQPRFVEAVKQADGTVVKPAPVASEPITLKNPKNWDAVIAAMRDVVASPHGTAHYGMAADKLAYTVAGKTGTAQVSKPKIYTDGDSLSIPKKFRNQAWFIAFAPAEDPKIALAVLVEHHSHQGPVVARKILDYYMLPDHGVKADAARKAAGTQEEAGPSD